MVQILWDFWWNSQEVWRPTDLVHQPDNSPVVCSHLGITVAPSQMFFLSLLCHMEADSLSRDCTVAPTSHQALFSSGNHPCPYLCSPGSCYDNSLCLISLLFIEWHLNDHFMDQWNAPMWIKRKKNTRCNNNDHRNIDHFKLLWKSLSCFSFLHAWRLFTKILVTTDGQKPNDAHVRPLCTQGQTTSLLLW